MTFGENKINRLIGPVLSIGLILAVFYLLLLTGGCPKPALGAEIRKHAVCPIDGSSAWYTRQQRTSTDGKMECQYKHIRFHFNEQGFFIEEVHVFWQECQTEE